MSRRGTLVSVAESAEHKGVIIEPGRTPAAAVVRFTYGADGRAVRAFYEQAVVLLDRGVTRLIVDMEGLPYVPSGLLGMLINVNRKCRSSGAAMRVVTPTAELRKTFEISRLDVVLTLVSSVEAAYGET